MHALATRLCDAFRDLMDAPAPGQTRAGAAISAPPWTPPRVHPRSHSITQI
jgi:hypothetical protein